MENSKEKSRIGGILSIVSGAFGILGAFILVIIILLLRYFAFYSDADPFSSPGEFVLVLTVIYGVSAVVMLALGILGIVGGTFALKRKHWGVALAAAISGAFTFFPCGVAAIVLVSLARPEFTESKPSSSVDPLPYS